MVRRIDNDGTTIWTKYIENNQGVKSNSRRNTFSVGFSIVQVRIDLLASYWLKISTSLILIYLYHKTPRNCKVHLIHNS